MIKETSPINFKSKIRLITPAEFAEKTKWLSKKLHKADEPWTPNEIKTGDALFTDRIMDCVAGGIVSDKTAKIFHQGHWTEELAKKYHQKVFDINELEKKLLEGINLANKKLHGFLLGGFESKDFIFTEKIRGIFKKHNIPYTEFTSRKDVHHYGKFSILYERKTDTWSITNALFDAKDLNGVEKALGMKDNIVEFVTYGKAKDGYPKTRHFGTVEDFLKSQFNNVSLCKFDQFV